MSVKLPDFVLQRIQLISQKTGISVKEITGEYLEIFRDPFIQEDPQFTSDEERHRYAAAVLRARDFARPPGREYEIIPIGFSGKRLTETGTPMSTVYVLVKDSRGVKLKRLVLRDEMADLYKVITLFAKYKVKLGEFSSGDLVADNRAKFNNPVKLKLSPQDILAKIGVQRVANLKQTKNFISKIGSDGYVVETDWKVVRGIIVRAYRGTRKDGTEFGVYTIVDDSLEDEPIVTPDGKVIPPGFSVWVAPEQMIYAVESECDFAGTIQVGSDKQPFMNAYLVIPVHARTEL